jgi:hypothetical protein
MACIVEDISLTHRTSDLVLKVPSRSQKLEKSKIDRKLVTNSIRCTRHDRDVSRLTR